MFEADALGCVLQEPEVELSTMVILRCVCPYTWDLSYPFFHKLRRYFHCMQFSNNVGIMLS